MKERPILFSAPMVRAILAGTKTQTRRAVKPAPVEMVAFRGADDQPTGEFGWCPHERVITKHVRCPYGAPSDRLWVRETFGRTNPGGDNGVYFYRADEFYPEILYGPGKKIDLDTAWTPSIFMPRVASRITLEVTGVRVERLNDISTNDAIAEGAEFGKRQFAIPAYREVWEEINGHGSWDANPWVWVVEFKPIQQYQESVETKEKS